MGKEERQPSLANSISAQQQEKERSKKLADEAREREVKALQESIKARVDYLNDECCAFLAPYAALFKQTGAVALLIELRDELLKRETKLFDNSVFLGAGCDMEYFWPDPHHWHGDYRSHSSRVAYFSGEDFSGQIEEEAINNSICRGVSLDDLKFIAKRINSISPQGKHGFKFLRSEAWLGWRTYHVEVWDPNDKQIRAMNSPLTQRGIPIRFGAWHNMRTAEKVPDAERNIGFLLTEGKSSIFRTKRLQLELKYFFRGKDQIWGEKSFLIPERQWEDKERIRKILAQAYVELSP